MAEPKKAANTLAPKVTNNEVAPAKKTSNTIFDMIESYSPQFQKALPTTLGKDFPQRFIRIAQTSLRLNPKLMECSKESLLGALMQIAQLGLEPGGVLNQAYLIPFKNTKLGTMEAQFQLSYKGMIQLLRRTGELLDIYGYPVYQGEEFKITLGLNRDLVHVPDYTVPRKDENIAGMYVVAKLRGGVTAFEYMAKPEIVEREIKYRKGAYKTNIWEKNFIEMGKKTVAKKMLAWLPISAEVLEMMRKDETVSTVKDVTSSEWDIDSKYINEDYDNVNMETGEYKEAEVQASDEPITLSEGFIKTSDDVKFNYKEAASDRGINLKKLSVQDADLLQELLDKHIDEQL